MDPVLRRLLFGSAAVMAPPNDQGGGGDPPDEDDEFDPGEDDDQDDTGEDLGEDDLDESGEDESDEEEEPPLRQTRGETRAANATRIAAEAKREAAALRAELDELKRRPATVAPQETREQFQARLDSMDPVARVDYLRQLDRSEMQQQLQRIEFNSQDSADRTEFEALAARNPVAAKLKADVEKALVDMRRNGQTAPRKTILAYLIGERALERAPRAKGKAERDAASRRERHAAKPGSGRGDAAAEGRKGNDRAARDKRLENMEI